MEANFSALRYDADLKNINSLNNDCFLEIFNYFSTEEKLKLELVCKRWNNLSKFTWKFKKT